MDVFAHSLWTNVMYKAIPQTANDKKTTYWGIAFGVLPDLLVFTPVFIVFFFSWISGNAHFNGPPLMTDSWASTWAMEGYNYTHSLVIWAVATLIVWGIRRKFPWIFLGWALHIVIDIFSHTNEFYATPFLFPISNFKVSLLSWGHPVFMIINYGLLALTYIFILPKLKKHYSTKSNNNIDPTPKTNPAN